MSQAIPKGRDWMYAKIADTLYGKRRAVAGFEREAPAFKLREFTINGGTWFAWCHIENDRPFIPCDGVMPLFASQDEARWLADELLPTRAPFDTGEFTIAFAWLAPERSQEQAA